MGHRDVSGTTECPADSAHTLIPAIRDEVAARLGLESPHIIVDEVEQCIYEKQRQLARTHFSVWIQYALLVYVVSNRHG